MTPSAVCPSFAHDIEFIKNTQHRAGLWDDEIKKLLARAQDDCSNIDDMLDLIQKASRLADILTAGLEQDRAFKNALEQSYCPPWHKFTSPPAATELQDGLADKLYNIEPAKTGEHAYITLGNGARYIGRRLIEKCMADQIPFTLNFTDPNFTSLLLNHSDDEGIKALADAFLEKTAPVTKRIVAVPGLPAQKALSPDPDKSQRYSTLIKPYSERGRSGDLFFTLTVIPTEKDAEIDHMNYKDYVKMFFEMCDQPWDAIDHAQQKLIAELNAGKTLRFTNTDGTDIQMDIDGFTFCNSLIAKNVPGSEVFSAPRRDSVNGQIVAKGRFTPPQDRGEIIENLTMEFKDGKLVSYDADSGLPAFERMIDTDEGARYIGEVGIGTNPHLKKHVCNGLLVEKIGGSFHLALGACYTMKNYQGTPVQVDNGNQSAIHWDITTMLYGKQGRIYLDDRLIMDDGRFIAPEYDVLNRGWAAIPPEERPAYWQNYYS